MSALSDLKQEYIIRNAHRLLAPKFKRQMLWYFVSQVTGCGAGVAHTVCQELGWNPDADASKSLPSATVGE